MSLIKKIKLGFRAVQRQKVAQFQQVWQKNPVLIMLIIFCRAIPKIVNLLSILLVGDSNQRTTLVRSLYLYRI